MISDEILCKLPSDIPVYTVEFDYIKPPTRVNLWEAVVELVDARKKIVELEQRILSLEHDHKVMRDALESIDESHGTEQYTSEYEVDIRCQARTALSSLLVKDGE